jgi:PAS domain-containing protein
MSAAGNAANPPMRPARPAAAGWRARRSFIAALVAAALLIILLAATSLRFLGSSGDGQYLPLVVGIMVVTSLLLGGALSFACLILRPAPQPINEQLQQANLTLRDSEEKLAVTLDSIGDAVIATDAGARVSRA